MPTELEKKFCPRCLKQFNFRVRKCPVCRKGLERVVPEPRIRHLQEYEHKTQLTDVLI